MKKNSRFKVDIHLLLNNIKYIIWLFRTNFLLQKGYYKFGIKRLKSTLLRKIGLFRLKRIQITPSHQCNANCPHCYEKFRDDINTSYLSTDECKNIIDQFEKLGGFCVYLIGGEFIMRNDALEIIKYCSDKKMMTHITSNGILLDEKMISRLKEAGLTTLAVSIDSTDPVKHDSLRGAGAFTKAIKGLKLAKAEGIKTEIWTYMTKSHDNDLDNMAELGKKLGVEMVLVFLTFLSGNLLNKPEENFSFADRKNIRKKYLGKIPIVFHFTVESDKCWGGDEYICVQSTGDVSFCTVSPYGYGNIRQKSLASIAIDIEKDSKNFAHCTGQCLMNFQEYRAKGKGKYIYGENNN
jgi:MoaA/NifB/PqqE/SkfB family radical SAM enzyme